jgi:hypothetical protein
LAALASPARIAFAHGVLHAAEHLFERGFVAHIRKRITG